MDEPTAAILGAAIGGASGLTVALLTGWRQSRLEYQKWLRAREDEQRKWLQAREDDKQKEIRLAIVELTKNLSIALQAMEWLTWKAENAPNSLIEEDISVYDKDMRAVLPKIVSSHVLVAALSKTKYDRLTPLVDEVYNLDVQIAKASLLFKNSPQECIQALAAMHNVCLRFHRKLQKEVTEIISYRDNDREI
jgi:hypothetical protein